MGRKQNYHTTTPTSDEWLFTQYDAFGRVAYTGKAIAPEDTDGTQRALLQDEVSGLSGRLWADPAGTSTITGGAPLFYDTGGYPSGNSTATISEVLTVNYYDRYIDRPSGAPLSIDILDDPDNAVNSTNVKGLVTVQPLGHEFS